MEQPARNDPARAADRAVGFVFMIVGAALMLALLLLQAALIAIFGPLFARVEAGSYPGADPFQPLPATIPSIFLGLLFAYCAALFSAGFGIHASRSWGFDVGVIVCALMMFWSGGSAVFGLAGAVYCVLGRISVARTQNT
jgi:hypothetical protein